MARSDWLYPVSKDSGSYWEDTDRGVTADISLDNFRNLVVPDLLHDSQWGISHNFRSVTRGDRVWIYLSGGTGVIGVATVIKANDLRGRRSLDLRIKRAASRRLCDSPLPSGTVHRFVPYPRAALVALDRFPKLVVALERRAGI